MRKKAEKIVLGDLFTFKVKDALITITMFAVAAVFCMLVQLRSASDAYVPMIFILAVFFVARFTDGYFWGIISSFIGVLGVNYFFTYPYFQFNFTNTGYPVTMVCMLAVAFITGTMTTGIKRAGKLKIEAEREKMRGNLLRAVSHDLRTPLTSIYGSCSAMLENDELLTSETRIKLLTEIRDDAQWLIQMVENLLNVTRIETGGSGGISKNPEAVEELIPDAVSKFHRRFPDYKINVEVPRELLLVPMDAMLIGQVLLNLLENSVIHSGLTADRLIIKLTVKHEPGQAVFIVADNGNGISADRLKHIFDGSLTFSSADSEAADTKRNMGIGLSVCLTIIEAHGGTMTAENETDGGAVFSFTLPLGEITGTNDFIN